MQSSKNTTIVDDNNMFIRKYDSFLESKPRQYHGVAHATGGVLAELRYWR
jgi:hypothetical protein